ncbi:hypothetical protein [Vibrio brasiliensis]|uniref:hypothetical protein n=1 Tax=Vibrio brasiliensis TaxID=170652 RepID=UPI001EFE3733|nr:hypothetical protein [Vibrio brasiliensis]MCG9726755.1 hypothetical protein [Vibrio brasiliensis]
MKCQTSTHQQLDNSSVITASSKATFQRVALNVLIIAALSIFVNLCLRIDFTLLHHGLGENSVTELAQSLMLAIASMSFFTLSRNNREIRHASVLIGGFFAVLFIRESDMWFDMVFHGAWVIPALLITALSCYYALREGRSSIHQLAEILNSRFMPTLITAVVLLLVFSRLYGMGSFWHSVMGEHYLRDVKNLSEEGIELLCYSLIAFCSVKTYFLLRKRSAQGQTVD